MTNFKHSSYMCTKHFISIICIATFFGCSSIQYVNASDFVKIGSRIEEMNSATFTQYIGHSRDRAYIEDFSAIRFGKNKTVVYWTKIDQLPDSIRAIIIENKNPWVPWIGKNKGVVNENEKSAE